MLRPVTLLKKRLWHRCFPVNFAKFLRTPFLTEHFRWLLLDVNIRSIHGEEVSNMCAGSLITWCNSNWDVSSLKKSYLYVESYTLIFICHISSTQKQLHKLFIKKFKKVLNLSINAVFLTVNLYLIWSP